MQVKIDLNDIICLVVEEVDYCIRDDSGAPGELALYSANGTPKKPMKGKGKPCKGRSESKNMVCHNCSHTSHYKSKCWCTGGGKEGQGRKQSAKKEGESATVAEVKMKVTNSFAFTSISDYAYLSTQKPRMDIIIDSGESLHFCPDCSKFTTSDPLDKSTTTTADSELLEAARRGNVRMTLPNRSGQSEVTLLDAVYAPEMPFTLILVHKLDEAKCNVRFCNGTCLIMSTEGMSIATVPSSRGLYKLGVSENTHPEKANIAHSKMSLMEPLCHLRHISCNSIFHAVEN